MNQKKNERVWKRLVSYPLWLSVRGEKSCLLDCLSLLNIESIKRTIVSDDLANFGVAANQIMPLTFPANKKYCFYSFCLKPLSLSASFYLIVIQLWDSLLALRLLLALVIMFSSNCNFPSLADFLWCTH